MMAPRGVLLSPSRSGTGDTIARTCTGKGAQPARAPMPRRPSAVRFFGSTSKDFSLSGGLGYVAGVVWYCGAVQQAVLGSCRRVNQ